MTGQLIYPTRTPEQENTMTKDDVYKRLFKAEATADDYRQALEEIAALLQSAKSCTDIIYIGTLFQRLEHIAEKALKH